ncbi:putative ABC-type xenobiotic transporter [Microsporum audouinii]
MCNNIAKQEQVQVKKTSPSVILSESEKIVGLQLNGLPVGLDSPISYYPETSFRALYLMLGTVAILSSGGRLEAGSLGSGYVRLIILSLFGRKVPQAKVESAAYASEAVRAIRTVESLGLENDVLRRH